MDSIGISPEKKICGITIIGIKKAIISAMETLLVKKNFNDITIKMICYKAKISRSGFYLHYTDKFDLVISYQKEFMAKGMKILSNKGFKTLKELMEYMVNMLMHEGKLLALLISDNWVVESQQTMKQLMKENAKKNILPYLLPNMPNDTYVRYFLSFYSNALFGVLQEWIHSGQKESPEELVAILNKLIFFDTPLIKQNDDHFIR
ncbi:TetR/AcrR family transcriptional regulator [Vagococcus sp. JNUCC 83]